MEKEKHHPLTPYPEGSFQELLHVALPLMLSLLSGTLMLFVDRIILAKFSLQAMNAATLAGVTFIVFSLGTMALTSIAEVFVAQLNGDRQYRKISAPVWQMIWLSFMFGALSILAALFLPPYILSDYYYEEHGKPYFQCLLIFGGAFPLQAALASFYIGIGKVRLLTIVALFANVLNGLLDLALIFGIDPWIPSMGTQGAALATGISQSLQVAILFGVFLNRHHQERYHSGHPTWDWLTFKKCLFIGGPASLGLMIELTAWAVVNQMMIWVSEEHLTILSIGKSFFILVVFAIHGIQKGVTAVVGNLIGANKIFKIPSALHSGYKLLFLTALLISPLLIFYPDPLIGQFLSAEYSTTEYGHLFSTLKVASMMVWLYFVLDGFTWTTAGVLVAAGDTLFVMGMNGFSAWVFAVVPIYVIVVQMGASPLVCWALLCLYGSLNSAAFYLRYKRGAWLKNKNLV
jgi:MATE family multidrug resistance protein